MKILTLSLLLILTCSYIAFVSPVHAVGPWIKSYTIKDASTQQLLYDSASNTTYAPILQQSEIIVTFDFKFVASGTGDLTLMTSLSPISGTTPWAIITSSPSYSFSANGANWNPSSTTTKFAGGTTADSFTLSLTARVPISQTGQPFNIGAVVVKGGDGVSVIDQVIIRVSTGSSSAFDTLYASKQDELQSLKDKGVAAGYTDLYESVLTAAKVENDAGNSAEAVKLLQSIDTSNPPVIAGSMDIVYIPILVVLAAVAGIGIFMFIRARGKVSYFTLVVEDQIKDLEGLTMRAAKLDRTMSSNLESVKDRLKRLVGM
jgi:hypothetical protein